MNQPIPFTKPYLTGLELDLITQALQAKQLHGNGPFTKKCQEALEKLTACPKVLLTNSCTAALEMSVVLAHIQPGDEVILPSFTFVSTANAIVLQGGIPVFINARPDTFNIDETKIEAAITSKTKAILCVHYAGVACEMDTIIATAKKHHLIVIEDAAQGVQAYYNHKALGTLGDLGTFSFHGTKNIISGEGGSLLVNNRDLIERAEIIWEKGTNRKQFLLGEVDKYSWVDIGSSYLPSEITAAFLYAQLQAVQTITEQRLNLWNLYHQALEELEKQGKLRRPIIPANCQHNAHLYHILLNNMTQRNELMFYLREKGIQAVTHYVPLHDSIGGLKFGRTHGDLHLTHDIADRILRLPLFTDLTTQQINYIIDTIAQYFKK
jgi:dTDP-4-amino-4,6-dideoxygalactose transaminase